MAENDKTFVLGLKLSTYLISNVSKNVHAQRNPRLVMVMVHLICLPNSGLTSGIG